MARLDDLYDLALTGTPDSCTLWPYATNTRGYAQVKIKQVATQGHRLVCRLVHGLTDTQVVLHSCDTPNCINPYHLTPGTMRDNMRDMASKGRGRNRYTAGS